MHKWITASWRTWHPCCQWVTRDSTTDDSFKREVCLGVPLLCLNMDAETPQVKAEGKFAKNLSYPNWKCKCTLNVGLLFSLVLWIHGIFFYYIQGEMERKLLLGNVFFGSLFRECYFCNRSK